eukprot:5045983-Pleurochrysis_carterae.AAC.1
MVERFGLCHECESCVRRSPFAQFARRRRAAVELAPRGASGELFEPRFPGVVERLCLSRPAVCHVLLRRCAPPLSHGAAYAVPRDGGPLVRRVRCALPPKRRLRALGLARRHAPAVGRLLGRVRPAAAWTHRRRARCGRPPRGRLRRLRLGGRHCLAVAPCLWPRAVDAGGARRARDARRLLEQRQAARLRLRLTPRPLGPKGHP